MKGRKKKNKIILLFILLLSFFFTFISESAPLRGKTRKIVLKELIIRGKIQKPEAMIILQRSTKSKIFDEQLRGQSFIEKTIDSVEDENLN